MTKEKWMRGIRLWIVIQFNPYVERKQINNILSKSMVSNPALGLVWVLDIFICDLFLLKGLPLYFLSYRFANSIIPIFVLKCFLLFLVDFFSYTLEFPLWNIHMYTSKSQHSRGLDHSICDCLFAYGLWAESIRQFTLMIGLSHVN